MPWNETETVERGTTLKKALEIAANAPRKPVLDIDIELEKCGEDGEMALAFQIPLNVDLTDVKIAEVLNKAGQSIGAKMGLNTIGFIPRGSVIAVTDNDPIRGAGDGTVTKYGVKISNPVRISLSIDLSDAEVVSRVNTA